MRVADEEREYSGRHFELGGLPLGRILSFVLHDNLIPMNAWMMSVHYLKFSGP